MSTNVINKLLSGTVWTLMQVLANKFVAIATQLILAWILLPEHFGKISLVYTFTSIGGVLQNFGLTDVLISRGKSFQVLLPLAKSITLVMASASFVVVLLLGWIGGIIYDDIEITYLVLIYSLSIPFNTFMVIPDVKLRLDEDFKRVAIAQGAAGLLTNILTVCFALLSFGVYSFVLPLIISPVLKYVYLNYHAKIGFFFTVTFKHWKHLVGNSSLGVVFALCFRVMQQFDYAILGLFVVKAEVGIYYMAFSLSVQMIGLLVGPISSVLFPTLRNIPKNDTEQIRLIFKNMLVVFSLVGMPFAFLQVTAIESVVHLFLSEKWYDSILLVQILSVSVGFQIVGILWTTALRLKSEFKKQAYYAMVSAVSFIGLVTLGTFLGHGIGTALAVTVFNMVSVPLLIYLSTKSYGIKWNDVLGGLGKYFGLSLFIFGGFFLLSGLLVNKYLVLIINSVFPLGCYGFLVYLLDKELVLKLYQKIRRR